MVVPPSASTPTRGPIDPYGACNYWLFPRLRTYAQWSDREFGDVLGRLARLPLPLTPEAQRLLADSRLGQTLPYLAKLIGSMADREWQAPTAVAAARLAALWFAARPLVRVYNDRAYASFLTAARLLQAPASLLDDIRTVAGMDDSAAPAPGSERAFALHVHAAIAERNAEKLATALAATTYSGFNWGVFARVATENGDPRTLETVWRAAAPHAAGFPERTWGSFATAAGRLEFGGLLTAIWRTFRQCSIELDGPLAGIFASAAMRCAQPDVLTEVVSLARQAAPRLDGRAWSALATAAGRLRLPASLGEIWGAADAYHRTFTSWTWGSFANAAARAKDSDLLGDVWRAAGEAGFPLDGPAWGTFANAAAEFGDGALLREVWRAAAPARVGFDAKAWGSFANAAARAKDSGLLGDVWRAAAPARVGFDAKAWGSFGNAAADVGDAELLREIWEASAPVHPLFEHAAWGTFIAAASAVADPALLRSVFRELAGGFDPTRLPHWGTLYYPLVQAAITSQDPEVRAEILDTVRGRRIDVDHCIAVLAEEPPQPLAATGGRFEGACRTIMRFLIQSYFTRPDAEFGAQVRQVVDRILGLPTERAVQVWPRFLGRGQEAYAAALRTGYAEAFAATARVPRLPWESLSEVERARFVADLVDGLPGGLIARLSSFISEFAATALAKPQTHVEGGVCPGVIEFLIDNHFGHLEGRPPERGGPRFFEECERHLAWCGSDRFTPARWQSLVRTLINIFAARLALRMQPALQATAHDIEKTVCQSAHERLRESDVDQAETQMIAAGVLDMLQCFDLVIARVGAPPRERALINIVSQLRRILAGRLAYGENSHVHIPDSAYILAWPGAKADQVIPLLTALRSNVENALRNLTPERRRFRCSVTEDGEWLTILVENTFQAGGSGDPYSTGIGLHSIRRRALLLGGPAPIFTRRTVEDPPVFAATVRLPTDGTPVSTR